MSKKIRFSKQKMVPLLLLFLVVVIDQISKIIIVRTVGVGEIGFSFGGDFFRIIHVVNPGIAFSIGHGWSLLIRSVLFRVLPLIVLIFVLFFYFFTDDLSLIQRWAISGIVGGGFGNLIDRFFRSTGVVDFIDVKFYGLFGFERWPTFNIADSAVVVCGIILVISFLFAGKSKKSEGEK